MGDEEAVIEKKDEIVMAEAELSRYDLVNQQKIARQLPVWVRILGVLLAFLAVICTWETVDHLVVFLFPHSTWQIVAYLVLEVTSMVVLRLSKMLNDVGWVDLGSFGFILGSVGAAAATWGLVEAHVRIYFEKNQRLGVWFIGSLLALAASFLYLLLTKHNALLDIASCAISLGYFDSKDDLETKIEADGENYKGCS